MANIQTAALFGFLGAVAAEILALYKLRQIVPTQYPHYLKSFFHYWVPTILMSLMGGVIAVAYALDGTQFGTVLAMNIGASAPLVIGTWTKDIPKISE
jgi:hypothetical protein